MKKAEKVFLIIAKIFNYINLVIAALFLFLGAGWSILAEDISKRLVEQGQIDFTPELVRAVGLIYLIISIVVFVLLVLAIIFSVISDKKVANNPKDIRFYIACAIVGLLGGDLFYLIALILHSAAIKEKNDPIIEDSANDNQTGV